MAEPRDEQIFAQVKTTLAAIVADGGTTYWYTPKAVLQADFSQAVNFDALLSPLIILRPGEMKNTPRTTARGHQTEMEIFATVAQKSIQLASSPQFQTTDALDRTLKSRMTNDVRRALDYAWPSWALDVHSLEVTDRDEDVAMDGWAVAHLRILVTYSERL